MPELDKIIIVVLIMSAFILGVSTFTGDLATNFPNVQNASFLDASSQTSQKINSMQNNIQDTGESSSTATIMVNGVWKVITILLSVVGIFSSLITDMATVFMIPAGFVGIFVAIVTIMIIFGIVYLVMNLRS